MAVPFLFFKNNRLDNRKVVDSKMIDLEQQVEMKWMAGIKDRYVGLGYTFTKHRDKFSVKVKRIP